MKKSLEEMTEPELRQLMSDLANTLEWKIKERTRGPKKPQFVLVLFDDPKIAQYVASCSRESMIEAMRETAERLEKKQDVPR